MHEEILAAVLGKGDWIGEITDRAKDGRSIIVECRCSVVRDDRGVPVSILVIKTDITEKKDIERQFLRAQRMESIGTLAAGIAHDLNNVLAPITMSIAMLRSKIVDSSGLRWVDTIDVSAARAADIVRQVLGFGRGIEGHRILFHPGHVMREVLKITGETFPKSIAIHMSIPDNVPMVVADPTQVHQVLLNLCVNARDAMPYGGTLESNRRKRNAGRTLREAPHRCPPGDLSLSFRDGHGDGDPAGSPGQDVRPVLHDEAAREGDRPRAIDGAGDIEESRRLHQRVHGTGPRDDV